ncbi:hypothetical protein CONLIGDRAFT_572094 [Coniochaeta ligniaria NRRL 30616]|uniref:Rhodopsin domain-containing protein n=1 Tax=Coniochaeta ligniaria NRRL 30616 TaxID=1408157 RepID=A0A1J7JF24_9PEZI|nr:hypothetical protein CONLIGDRAFT_572094 [Coniochaeta ligniaria NRRL 30616]
MSQAKCNNVTGCPPSVPFSKFAEDEDFGPATRIAIWLLTGVSAVFLCLRLYCKFIRHRRLHLDDWVLIASWLATLAGTICTTIAIGLGFGKRGYEIPFDNFGTLIVVGLLSVTFDIIGQAWSKTSFAITILRISEGKLRVFIWFAIISMNVLLGLGAMSFWVQCSPIEKSWNPLVPGVCWDPRVAIVYGIFASGYSGVMDLVLAILPWNIIMSLQMKTKEKIGVALAMSMGVFAAASAFIKCSAMPELASQDFSHDGIPLVIWGIAEAAVTIMAASVPMLRILVKTVKATNRHNQRPRIIDPDNDQVKLVRPHRSRSKQQREREGSANLYRLEQSLVSRL